MDKEPKEFLSPKLKENSNTMNVVCLIAIAHGVLGLADLSMSYFYKDDCGLSPAQVSLANSITTLPWIVKPIWGFTSDCLPIAGKRRAPYLKLFGVLGVMAWIYMSMYVHTAISAVVTMLVIQISNAFCNVIGEALVVEESQKAGDDAAQASKNVSLFFGLRSVGIIATAYTGGLLLEVIDKRSIFLITASFPLLMCLASTYLEEAPITEKPKVKEQFLEIWNFIKQPNIASPIIFILLFMMTPSSADAMFYFYTNELGFKPEFMGRLKMAHGLANLIGIYLYNKYLKNTNFKSMMLWSTVICAGASCTQLLLVSRANISLHIPDTFFSLTSGFLVQAIAEINTMPLLVLCCRLCPKNIEGSLYALLMSTMNLGGLISYQLGGVLMVYLGVTQTEFHNLWLLIVVVNLFMLLPLPLLKCVPDVKSNKENGYDDV